MHSNSFMTKTQSFSLINRFDSEDRIFSQEFDYSPVNPSRRFVLSLIYQSFTGTTLAVLMIDWIDFLNTLSRLYSTFIKNRSGFYSKFFILSCTKSDGGITWVLNGFYYSTFLELTGWWTRGFFLFGGDKNLNITLGLLFDELLMNRGRCLYCLLFYYLALEASSIKSRLGSELMRFTGFSF